MTLCTPSGELDPIFGRVLGRGQTFTSRRGGCVWGALEGLPYGVHRVAILLLGTGLADHLMTATLFLSNRAIGR